MVSEAGNVICLLLWVRRMYHTSPCFLLCLLVRKYLPSQNVTVLQDMGSRRIVRLFHSMLLHIQKRCNGCTSLVQYVEECHMHPTIDPQSPVTSQIDTYIKYRLTRHIIKRLFNLVWDSTLSLAVNPVPRKC